MKLLPLHISSILIFLYTYSMIISLSGKFVAIICVIWFIGLLVFSTWQRFSLRSDAKWVAAVYAALFLIYLISVLLAAHDKKYGLSLILSSFLPLLFAAALIGECKKHANCIEIFIGMQCAFAIFLVGYFFSHYGIAMRATGDPEVDASINNLAATLAVGAALSIKVGIDSNNFKALMLGGLGWAVSLLGIALTYSRGAMAFVLLISAMLVIRRWFKAKAGPQFLLLCLGAVALVNVIGYVEDISSSAWWMLFESRLESAQDGLRHETHRVAWMLFQDNPLFGIGYSNFPLMFSKLGGESMVLRLHDDVAEAFVELGVLGGMLFLVLIALSVKAWIAVSGGGLGRMLWPGIVVVLLFAFVRPMQSFWLWHFFVLLPFFLDKSVVRK